MRCERTGLESAGTTRRPFSGGQCDPGGCAGFGINEIERALRLCADDHRTGDDPGLIGSDNHVLNIWESGYRSFGSIGRVRSEEHTSELQSLMRISYAVFCLKNKTLKLIIKTHKWPPQLLPS